MASLAEILRRRRRESGTETLRREEGVEGERSQRFEGREGESRRALAGFDPMEATRETAQAVGADMVEGFQESEAGRAANLSSRGLFGSNLGGGRATRDFNERLTNALASISQRGAGMRLGQLSEIRAGDVGRAENSRDRQLDLISGRRDAELARYLARKRSSDSKFAAVANFASNLIPG